MREEIYSGKILSLSKHHVKIEGRSTVREMVEHGGAAAIAGI